MIKRHRDFRFSCDADDRPTSIIITTLSCAERAWSRRVLTSLRMVSLPDAPELPIERERSGRVKTAQRRRKVLTRPKRSRKIECRSDGASRGRCVGRVDVDTGGGYVKALCPLQV